MVRPELSRIVVFREPTLLPWRTVRDNIALGLQARNVRQSEFHRVDEALARVGLSEFANSYPHQLSGGTPCQRTDLYANGRCKSSMEVCLPVQKPKKQGCLSSESSKRRSSEDE